MATARKHKRVAVTKPGYYRLADGEIIKLILRTQFNLITENIWGHRTTLSTRDLEGAEACTYRLTPAEYLKVSEASVEKIDDETKRRMESIIAESTEPERTRTQFKIDTWMTSYFTMLFEWGYLKLDTFGYYEGDNKCKHVITGLCSSISFRLAMFYLGFENKPNGFPPAVLAYLNDPEHVPWPQPEHPLSADMACPVTGLSFMWSFDGRTFRPAHQRGLRKEPVIPFKDMVGTDKLLPKLQVEIDVPSGELIFANDLRKWIDVEKDYSPENSINCQVGRHRNTMLFAEKGMFFVSIGNSCPRVYQNKKHSDLIRIAPSDTQRKGWEDMGSICTDLWAFCATDRLNLPGELDVEHFVLEVPPGRYQLTNHYEHLKDERKTYCEIKLLKHEHKSRRQK